MGVVELTNVGSRIQAQTFTRLVEGQILETVEPGPDEDPLEHYLEVVAGKTEAVHKKTLEACFRTAELVVRHLEDRGVLAAIVDGDGGETGDGARGRLALGDHKIRPAVAVAFTRM